MIKTNTKTYIIDIKRVVINNIIILAIFILSGIVMSYSFGKRQLQGETITVSSGDTLWKLASSICRNNDDLVIQNVIKDIKELNAMSDSNIYEAQELLLPIY